MLSNTPNLKGCNNFLQTYFKILRHNIWGTIQEVKQRAVNFVERNILKIVSLTPFDDSHNTLWYQNSPYVFFFFNFFFLFSINPIGAYCKLFWLFRSLFWSCTDSFSFILQFSVFTQFCMQEPSCSKIKNAPSCHKKTIFCHSWGCRPSYLCNLGRRGLLNSQMTLSSTIILIKVTLAVLKKG